MEKRFEYTFGGTMLTAFTLSIEAFLITFCLHLLVMLMGSPAGTIEETWPNLNTASLIGPPSIIAIAYMAANFISTYTANIIAYITGGIAGVIASILVVVCEMEAIKQLGSLSSLHFLASFFWLIAAIVIVRVVAHIIWETTLSVKES